MLIKCSTLALLLLPLLSSACCSLTSQRRIALKFFHGLTLALLGLEVFLLFQTIEYQSITIQVLQLQDSGLGLEMHITILNIFLLLLSNIVLGIVELFLLKDHWSNVVTRLHSPVYLALLSFSFFALNGLFLSHNLLNIFFFSELLFLTFIIFINAENELSFTMEVFVQHVYSSLFFLLLVSLVYFNLHSFNLEEISPVLTTYFANNPMIAYVMLSVFICLISGKFLIFWFQGWHHKNIYLFYPKKVQAPSVTPNGQDSSATPEESSPALPDKIVGLTVFSDAISLFIYPLIVIYLLIRFMTVFPSHLITSYYTICLLPLLGTALYHLLHFFSSDILPLKKLAHLLMVGYSLCFMGICLKTTYSLNIAFLLLLEYVLFLLPMFLCLYYDAHLNKDTLMVLWQKTSPFLQLCLYLICLNLLAVPCSFGFNILVLGFKILWLHPNLALIIFVIILFILTLVKILTGFKWLAALAPSTKLQAGLLLRVLCLLGLGIVITFIFNSIVDYYLQTIIDLIVQ